MRKFLWPLQRLLHVTEQRERAMRLEVLAVVQQAAVVKRQILRRQAVLRDLLAGLSLDAIERVFEQRQPTATAPRPPAPSAALATEPSGPAVRLS
jgi:hypothetical protein